MLAELIIFAIFIAFVALAFWNANRVPGKLRLRKLSDPHKLRKVKAYEVDGLLYREATMARIAQRETKIRKLIEECGYNKKEENTIYEFISEAGTGLLKILHRYREEDF